MSPQFPSKWSQRNENPSLFLATAVWAFLAPAAYAQSACFPYERLEATLSAEKYQERVGVTLVGEQSMFEIWMNLDTGTWSIVQVQIADGGMKIGCMRSSGKGGVVFPDMVEPAALKGKGV